MQRLDRTAEADCRLPDGQGVARHVTCINSTVLARVVPYWLTHMLIDSSKSGRRLETTDR